MLLIRLAFFAATIAIVAIAGMTWAGVTFADAPDWVLAIHYFVASLR